MKRMIRSALSAALAALLVLFSASCGGAADTGESPDTSAPAAPSVEYTEESLSLGGYSGTYARKTIDVPASEGYVFSARVRAETPTKEAGIGICAGTNEQEHTLDFMCTVGGELYSYASMYGAEKRSDLGRIGIAAASPEGESEMKVIRKGELFYLILDGTLCQIREFPCNPTIPGFSVRNATVSCSSITYTSDPAGVDAAIEECMSAYPLFGIGDLYANFRGIGFGEDGTVTVDKALMQKGAEYTRTAFAGRYTGDMEVSFTAKGLEALPSADTGTTTPCRLKLMMWSDNDVTDIVALGVANKQDRVETFSYNDVAQWFEHADLTGNSAFFDWSGDTHIRVVLTNTGHSITYSVYVNGALFAVRNGSASGSIAFGLEWENVSGSVSGFTVSGGERE